MHFFYHSSNGEANLTTSIKFSVTEYVPGIAYFAHDNHFYKVGYFPDPSEIGVGPDAGKFCESDTDESGYYIYNQRTIQTLTAVPTGTPVCTWNESNRLAKDSVLKGKHGYLANITSEGENDFLTNKLSGALNVWIGGTDGNNDGSTSDS